MVGIICENRHEIAAIIFAIISLNAISAPINFNYAERIYAILSIFLEQIYFFFLILGELIHTLNLSKPKFLITSMKSIEKIMKIHENLSFVEKIILLDGESTEDSFIISFNDLIDKFGSEDFDLNEYVQKPMNIAEKSSLILLSSGTTGLPKGVEFTQNMLHLSLLQMMENSQQYKHFPEGEYTSLNIAPWYGLKYSKS